MSVEWNLSLIIPTWRPHNYNLKSWRWFVIDMIYFVSLSFCTIFGVGFFSLSFFVLEGAHFPVCSRVPIMLNCDFLNTFMVIIIILCQLWSWVQNKIPLFPGRKQCMDYINWNNKLFMCRWDIHFPDWRLLCKVNTIHNYWCTNYV